MKKSGDCFNFVSVCLGFVVNIISLICIAGLFAQISSGISSIASVNPSGGKNVLGLTSVPRKLNHTSEGPLFSFASRQVGGPSLTKVPLDTAHDEGLESVAGSLGTFLKNVVEAELGIREIRDQYSSLQYDERRSEYVEDQAVTLSDLVLGQLKDYESALENLAQALKSNEEGFSPGSTPIVSCCKLNPESLVQDKAFNTLVNKYEGCKTVPPKSKPTLFIPSISFNKALIENTNRLPYLKWQYFVSPDGVHVEYPGNFHSCKLNGNSAQPVVNPKGPTGKKLWLIQKTKDDARNHRIVFLIQLGNENTPSMIKSVRNIVLLLLRFLDESDEVGIVNSDADNVWPDFLCDQMVPVTSWTRYQIMSYLTFIENRYMRSQSVDFEEENESDSKVTANGIQKAIDMACSNFTSSSLLFPSSAATIIHLRSGVNLDGFSLKSFKVNCPVFLDTFFLTPLNTTDEEKYKKTIQEVASKNIYRIQALSTALVEPEAFAVKVALKLHSKKEWWSLSDILSQFFPKPNEKNTKSIDFSLPHWNPISKEIVIIAKKFVFLGNRPLGLVAFEVPLTYFTQHITFYVNENVCDGRNYAFMIDKSGRVLSHPALGRPDISPEVLSPVQIDQIEVHREFAGVQKKLLTQDRGCQSLIMRNKANVLTYAWSVVGEFDYIVVLVLYDYPGCSSYSSEPILKKAYLNPKADIQHHLLLKGTQYCYKQAISTTKASLYLAPNAFTRPADAVIPQSFSKSSSKQPLALMAYIGDNSGFLQNQNRGLKSIVKAHVAAMSVSVEIWKRKHFNSELRKYFLRRYGTAGGGTFLFMFPGTIITNGYVPQSTKWFRLATIGTRKVTFTPPSIDLNSGIPYSTVSQAVYVNVDISTKNQDFPLAVVGADLNLGFFQKILEDAVPDCRVVSLRKESNDNSVTNAVRCFLLDESGYVIYHPQLAKSLKTLSNVHVTQLEPLYVIDMLQHSQFNHGTPMLKQVCHKLSEASRTQGSMQRIYTFNMTKHGYQKFKPGEHEHCSNYMIVPVPGTNLFVATIRDSCSSTAFCPCSTVDKLCLNCLRMEPSDCECPCECPKEPSFCSAGSFSGLTEDVVPCEFPGEILPMMHEESWNNCSGSQSTANCTLDCVFRQVSCENLTKYEECIGSWDCTWCDEVKDGSNATASCKTYRECYGYPLTKKTKPDEPEDELSLSGISATEFGLDDEEDEAGSAVLPAVGVLLVFTVFLALVVYCYRHRALNSSNSQPDLHLLPLQESPRCSIVPQAGSSRSDSDGEPFQVPVLHPIDLGNRGRRRQYRFFVPPRSPLGSAVATDSDHGYSTMTGHEDSECGATVPFVPVNLSLAHSSNSQEPRLAVEIPDVQDVDLDPSASQTQIKRVTVPVTIHHELPT